MARDTSKAALAELEADGALTRMQKRVLAWLTAHGPATRSEVDAGMREANEVNPSYHKRLIELERAGVVARGEPRPCSITGKNCDVWRATGEPARKPAPRLELKAPSKVPDGFDTASTMAGLAGVLAERVRQDRKFGVRRAFPDGTGGAHWRAALAHVRRQYARADEAGRMTWAAIFLEEVHEVLAEEDPVKLERELEQVAAVCVAWLEGLRRAGEGARKDYRGKCFACGCTLIEIACDDEKKIARCCRCGMQVHDSNEVKP